MQTKMYKKHTFSVKNKNAWFDLFITNRKKMKHQRGEQATEKLKQEQQNQVNKVMQEIHI